MNRAQRRRAVGIMTELEEKIREYFNGFGFRTEPTKEDGAHHKTKPEDGEGGDADLHRTGP